MIYGRVGRTQIHGSSPPGSSPEPPTAWNACPWSAGRHAGGEERMGVAAVSDMKRGELLDVAPASGPPSQRASIAWGGLLTVAAWLLTRFIDTVAWGPTGIRSPSTHICGAAGTAPTTSASHSTRGRSAGAEVRAFQ